MIEIVVRTVCPECVDHRVKGDPTPFTGSCPQCNGLGTVPRVLATFADAAEMNRVCARVAHDAVVRYPNAWAETLANGHEHLWIACAQAVLAALGVTDEKS